MKIQSQNQNVIKVKEILMDILQIGSLDLLVVREAHQVTEYRRWIDRVGQPVLIEIA